MLEKTIERKLTMAVKKSSGIAVKFVSPSFDGMPDRLVLLPDGLIAFVELKAPGKRPRPLQEARENPGLNPGTALETVWLECRRGKRNS